MLSPLSYPKHLILCWDFEILNQLKQSDKHDRRRQGKTEARAIGRKWMHRVVQIMYQSGSPAWTSLRIHYRTSWHIGYLSPESLIVLGVCPSLYLSITFSDALWGCLRIRSKMSPKVCILKAWFPKLLCCASWNLWEVNWSPKL